MSRVSSALTCPEHHRRIAGVRAASDGGDDHGAMGESEFAIVIDKRLPVVMMVWSNLEPFKPLLQEGKTDISSKVLTLNDEEILWEL